MKLILLFTLLVLSGCGCTYGYNPRYIASIGDCLEIDQCKVSPHQLMVYQRSKQCISVQPHRTTNEQT